MQDTVRAVINNNTIANNDSTATVGGLIINGVTTPQPAGISAERHSLALTAALPAGDPVFSSPLQFLNNIVWHNRAFAYDGAVLQPALAPATTGGCAAGASYWDLGVLGEDRLAPVLKLEPRRSILTDRTLYHPGFANRQGDPDFLSEYCNGARSLSTPGPMKVTAAFGEGGNLLDVRYGPLTQEPVLDWSLETGLWDYHVGAASDGLNNGATINNLNGTSPASALDLDGDVRPQGTGFDRGADEAF